MLVLERSQVVVDVSIWKVVLDDGMKMSELVQSSSQAAILYNCATTYGQKLGSPKSLGHALQWQITRILKRTNRAYKC